MCIENIYNYANEIFLPKYIDKYVYDNFLKNKLVDKNCIDLTYNYDYNYLLNVKNYYDFIILRYNINLIDDYKNFFNLCDISLKNNGKIFLILYSSNSNIPVNYNIDKYFLKYCINIEDFIINKFNYKKIVLNTYRLVPTTLFILMIINRSIKCFENMSDNEIENLCSYIDHDHCSYIEINLEFNVYEIYKK